MTRLEQARALEAKRQQTRDAIRVAIDALIASGRQPASTVMSLMFEIVIADLIAVRGPSIAALELEIALKRLKGPTAESSPAASSRPLGSQPIGALTELRRRLAQAPA